MIYLKNNSETQELYIPKNGNYQGKRTYREGFEEGIEYQKSKLSSIEITENGLYQNEDGYNEVNVEIPLQEKGERRNDTTENFTILPDEGYVAMTKVNVDISDALSTKYEEGLEEGKDIIINSLQTLNVTENGTYTSKYSDPIKTGEFEDGTPFYGYAELNNISYNTGILTDNDTKIELWWCGDVTQSDNGIIGWQSGGNFKICAVNNVNLTNSLNAEINYKGVNKQNLESYVWYHIELSKQEGFKINGELIGTFESVGDVRSSNIYLNTINTRNFANGKYGMLKINDTIFIPTENGFVNYANQEPMAVFTEGSYTYGTNEVDTEGEPYKTINVNIPPVKLQEKYEWRGDTTEYFTILPDDGYDGMSKVDVVISTPLSLKYNEGLEQGRTEGKESVINSLQTLNVTENGTYTPPTMPFLRLNGDDKYELFHPTDVNAFEIKFRVNSDGYTEFFSQNGNDIEFIGLRAHTDFSELYVNWFNKQILINDVDFSKWHTLVVKMSDENARVILDGQVYNDYEEFSSYEDNRNPINIYGDIDLEHFTFWNTWEDYNNGVTPYFNFKVTPEGLMRNHRGGEYGVVDNIGGGSAQYMGENISEGWNEVVVNVPQEGGDLNPDTLREITITENGIYTSKYSDPIKTGEFEDGTPFYGFGRVNGAVYDTEINLFDVGGDLRSLEFWYKGDYQDVADGWNIILSSNSKDRADEGSVEFRYNSHYYNINVRIGGIERYFNLEEGVWHHFKLDNMCTLFVDDEEIFTFPSPLPTSTNFYINGSVYNESFTRTANGYFGLIRINEEVIIPTEEGFMNYNTGDILPTLKEGSYSYGNYEDGGEPYKTINVDVNIPLQEKFEFREDTSEVFTILPDEGFEGMSRIDVDIYEPLQTKYNEGYERGIAEGGGDVPSKIDVGENGIKFAYSTFTEVPDFYDFSNVTDMSNMFRECSNLQIIGEIDTSNAVNINYMFHNCTSLTSIPPLQAGKLNMTTSFNGFIGTNQLPNITDFGGFIGLKCRLIGTQNLYRLPNLTYESCINVLNGLYDFTGNGETPTSEQGQLRVHQNFLDLVGGEITIGTNKGWTITA